MNKAEQRNDGGRNSKRPTYFEMNNLPDCIIPKNHTSDISSSINQRGLPSSSTILHCSPREEGNPSEIRSKEKETDDCKDLLDFLDEAAEESRMEEEEKNRTPSPSTRLQTKGENHWKLGHYAPKVKRRYRSRLMIGTNDSNSDSETETRQILGRHQSSSESSRQRRRTHLRTQLCFNLMAELDESESLVDNRNSENGHTASSNRVSNLIQLTEDDFEEVDNAYSQLFNDFRNEEDHI